MYDVLFAIYWVQQYKYTNKGTLSEQLLLNLFTARLWNSAMAFKRHRIIACAYEGRHLSDVDLSTGYRWNIP